MINNLSGAPGIFLDRDGVLNRFILESVRSTEEFEYYEFTAEAMRRLGDLECPIVVVTNQSAIGRGWTTEDQVQLIHHKLMVDCAEWGASISSVEYCPHLPDAGCDCRKPGSGMFLRAAKKHDIDINRSLMVGDSPCDIEAAQRLGMTSVRVCTGRGENPLPDGVEPDALVENLKEASVWIEKWFR